jgi:P-type Cu+ transporter
MSVNICDQVTTIIFISNLHCGRYLPLLDSPPRDLLIYSQCSCIDTIKGILQRLSPSTYSVNIHFRSQRVAVNHPTSLSGLIIREAIEDAGFDIADATNVGLDRPPDRPFSSIPSHKFKKHLEQCPVCQHDFKSRPDILEAEAGTSSKHSRQQRLLTLSVNGMTCASCTTTVDQALSELSGVHDVSVSLLGSSATATLDSNIIIEDLLETIRSIGYEAEVVSVHPKNLETTIVEINGPLRVTLTLAGMSHVSCSSTVTKLLSELEGVEDVSVDLIGNSASFVVENRNIIKETQEVIKSAGFEASVVTMEPVKTTLDTPNTAFVRRTVALRVEGMFCE